ncbi:MAG: DHH family phosphoesterase [Clostridia bacterium]|nr:DHH family phosphoesterase [Clostridia bacterium]
MEIFGKIRECYQGVPIYVLGHASPDTDTVLATELFCRFARRAGIDARPVRTGEIGKKERGVFCEHGIKYDKWVTETSADDLVFLVDCHTSDHAGKVIGCIDHHPTKEPVPESMRELYINGRGSSASLTVLRQAKDEGITITADDEITALISVFMDTQSMISPKFVSSDSEWVDRIIGKYGLDRTELVRLGFCFSDLTLPPEVLAFGGLKYHNIGGHRCASSHIEAENIPEELAKKCAQIADSRRRKEKLELWLLIVVEPLLPSTVIYEIGDGGTKVTKYDRMLSRSVDIIPRLEEKISQKN